MNYLLVNVKVQEVFADSYPSFREEYDKYAEFQRKVQCTHRLTRKEYEKLCEEFEQYRNETAAKLRAYYARDGNGVDKVICNEVKKFYKMLMYQSQIPLLDWFY